jgi:hypothetical protein
VIPINDDGTLLVLIPKCGAVTQQVLASVLDRFIRRAILQSCSRDSTRFTGEARN